MARIVIDARMINTSTGWYVNRLITYLQQIDKENEYLILLKLEDYDDFNFENKNVTKIKSPYKEFTFAEQFGLKKQLKQLKPDLVHFCMVQQPIFYRGKTVTTMHDLTTTWEQNPGKNPVIYWVKQQVYKYVNRRVPKKSSFIITPTKFVKDEVVKYAGIKQEKVYVTYEAGDDITETAEPIEHLRTKPFLVHVGGLKPHKNLTKLVEAFAILKKDHPELLLVLAGRQDPSYHEYLERAKELGVERDVVADGPATQGQKKWLMRTCRAYVLPSLSEGFSISGLEAMIQRAPVVCSTATCLPEVYGDGAWYFNPLDIYDMARSIDEVLVNKELRNKLILAGRKQAAKYSWLRMAEQTLDVYNKALNK